MAAIVASMRTVGCVLAATLSGKMWEEVCGRAVPYEIGTRRPRDPPVLNRQMQIEDAWRWMRGGR